MTYEIDTVCERSDEIVESATLKPGAKKFPDELRRRSSSPKSDTPFSKRILWRLQHDSQYLRTIVQTAFLLLCLWIGVEFSLFVRGGMSGTRTSVISRPPGVEGFLPISALISLKYWLQTGIINTIHPSGLSIFIAILLISFLMKKAFCSWMCPLGTVSESLWMLGRDCSAGTCAFRAGLIIRCGQ